MNVIKQLRLDRKITQEYLAYKLGITRQMISALELGANPSVEVLKQLAAYFGVTTDALLGIDSPPCVPQSDGEAGTA